MHNTLNHRRLIGAVIAATLLITTAFVSGAMAQDIAVIANKNVSENSLTKSDVKMIFFGQKQRWENGNTIVLALWGDSGAKESFLSQYMHKSPSQYSNYWRKQIFTGKGQMPASFDDMAEVVKFVGDTPGAIAFAAPGVSGDQIKIMEIK
jgi:ABC-type phosphate transport system substrate-binding protein